jgi:hypothetical protein
LTFSCFEREHFWIRSRTISSLYIIAFQTQIGK